MGLGEAGHLCGEDAGPHHVPIEVVLGVLWEDYVPPKRNKGGIITHAHDVLLREGCVEGFRYNKLRVQADEPGEGESKYPECITSCWTEDRGSMV